MFQLILAGAMAVSMAQTDTTFAVRANGKLEVDNFAGSVTVRSWARNEIRIQATHSSRTEVEIDRTGNTVSIDASGDNGPATVTYTITVPRSYRVAIDCVNSDIDVADVDGEVTAETVQGDVTVRGVNARVSAESISGDVVIENIHGHVSASATNQNITLSNIVGDLEVDATNGWVSALGIESSNVSVETVNGAIVLGTTVKDGGSYSVSTTNGTVTFGIPEGANASIDVSTYSGNLDTTLPLTMEKQKHGSYSLHTGTGSASIDIESFAGNVRLVRPADLRDASTRMKKK